MKNSTRRVYSLVLLFSLSPARVEAPPAVLAAAGVIYRLYDGRLEHEYLKVADGLQANRIAAWADRRGTTQLGLGESVVHCDVVRHRKGNKSAQIKRPFASCCKRSNLIWRSSA